MKVFLVIDETNFYQPNFVANLLECNEFEFVGCALVINVPKRNNIERYLIQNIEFLLLSEIIALGFKKIKYWIFDKMRLGKKGCFFSVKAVLKYYKIPYFNVKNDINKKYYLDRIKEMAPDIVLSSNSLYFKSEILNIPKFCINRHSSLLPAYGGLWPVFQALRRNEKFVGVSVHFMSQGIDKGKVLSQARIEVLPTDTVDSLYQKCFKLSAEVCIKALKGLSLNLFDDTETTQGSYFSFPSNEHWKEFRLNRKRFI